MFLTTYTQELTTDEEIYIIHKTFPSFTDNTLK